MAYFAYVTGTPGTVERVMVVANAALDPDNEEASGKAFLAELFNLDPERIVQCSYTGRIRGCYPGHGFTWDGTEFASPPAPAE